MKNIKNHSIQFLSYVKVGCFVLFQLFCHTSSFGQAVAITGVNTDGPDGFSLVALVDIPAGNNIFFTDMTYINASNTFVELDINGNPSTANGSVQVTWTGTWAEGTVIRVVETSTNVFTVTASAGGPTGLAATIVYAGDGFSLAGSDGFSVYTSQSTTAPETNIDEIYGFVGIDPGSSDPDPNLDPDCPCSNDFPSIDFNTTGVDGFNFNPALRNSAASLADFNNLSNYVTSTSNVTLDLTPFTNITFGSTSSLNALPVELIAFDAFVMDDEAVKLSWSTATEINNNRFEIERSYDGVHFHMIGTKQGTNTHLTQTYLHLDQNYDRTQSSIYYRLKQVDNNGHSTYTQIRRVLTDDTKPSGILSIYPNPAKEEIHLAWNTSQNEIIRLTIFDMNGKPVLNQSLNGVEGYQIKTLDVSQLKSGVYSLHLQSNSGIEQRTLIVQ